MDAELAMSRTPPLLGRRRGVLITVEGIWGAGKSTVAARLGERLNDAGFDTCVMHYGSREGAIGRLSECLERFPLRRRDGLGGYVYPHHATVDVLLRLCREAYHHRHLYRPALAEHEVVVVDHGIYSKLAYALAVLGEQHPDHTLDGLSDRVRAITSPWFLHPDMAVWLDLPWPLARERAIARGRGGGNPASVERLLFLPRYDAAYRYVAKAHRRVRRVRVGLRDEASVVAEATGHAMALLLNGLDFCDG